ncbi:hypothetical protein P154DRAFT_577020 [Amniculicola lignicola CBS 123094]|uniref:ABM domain-containing protein n=1 Tax=Amniculicola lignicola CBS 123094 TaxID=1392246 RepID=A0A6A5WDY9_9PLEO|nr:hypothetical protein P154DRAFT_577020 [Amniculicola lignicola CBS 123094]
MAGKYTTIAYLPLTADAKLDGAAEKVKAIKGVKQAYYGRQLEDPSIVNFAVDWSDSSKHDDLLASLTKGAAYAKLKPNLTGPPTIYTIKHLSGPGTLLNSTSNPLTEIATFFLLPSTTSSQLSEFNTAFKQLEAAVLAQPGQTTAAAGHVVGTLYNPAIEQDVKAFVATVGWRDMEAHIAFTQTPEFGTSLGALLPFLSGNADHHVALKRI